MMRVILFLVAMLPQAGQAQTSTVTVLREAHLVLDSMGYFAPVPAALRRPSPISPFDLPPR
jgi:hypothetical protein